MLKNRILYISFLLCMVVFFVFYEGWFSLFTLWVTLLLPFLSLLVSLILFRRVRICVDAETRLISGDDFSLTVYFTEKNAKDKHKTSRGLLFPGCHFTLKLEDRVSGKTEKEKMRLNAPDYAAFYEEPLHAGTYHFEIQRCKLTDILGLVSIKTMPPKPVFVTVFPRVTVPSPIPDVRALLPVSFTPSPSQGFSEITDIRDYRPGDPLRAVHWKLSAKTDDLLVKDPQDPVMKHIVIMLTPELDRDKLDITLGEYLWLSEQLLKLPVSFTLIYGTDHILLQEVIESREALYACMERLLDLKVEIQPEVPLPAPKDADRVFYIPERISS